MLATFFKALFFFKRKPERRNAETPNQAVAEGEALAATLAAGSTLASKSSGGNGGNSTVAVGRNGSQE
jgi:hypothetical protein